MKYANRAKNIRNEVKVNEDRNAKIIRELRREIARLKKRDRDTSKTSQNSQDEIDTIYRKNRALQRELEALHIERSSLLDHYQEMLHKEDKNENEQLLLESQIEDVAERLSKVSAEAAACGLFLDPRDENKILSIEILEELERVRSIR